MEMEMKLGDKVWVFNSITQTIVAYTVDGLECNRETEGLIHVFTEDDHIIGYYLGVNCFESREALCGHYRKIFTD